MFNSLCVLNTRVVYLQVAHEKCLHTRVPYISWHASALHTPVTTHTIFYKDVTNEWKLQNITHLSVSNPSIDAIFHFGNKEWNFTHLMWCKNLYYHRGSFIVTGNNIWWVIALWNYTSKAVSTIHRWHVSSIRICINSSSMHMCAALRVTLVYSKWDSREFHYL